MCSPDSEKGDYMSYESGEIQALDVEFGKPRVMHPDEGLAAVNPRTQDETVASHRQLMPLLLKFFGVITNPLLAWLPDVDDPIWESGLVHDVVTNETIAVPKEDRKKFLIMLRGHSRLYCAKTAIANPGEYSAKVIDNLSKLPVRVFTGSRENAERLALDDAESVSLYSWEVVKLVGKFLNEDKSWREIVLDQPKLIYKHLLPGGVAKYDKLQQETDGVKRLKETKSKMRNVMELWIGACQSQGPAMLEQLISFWRFEINSRPEPRHGNFTPSLMDLKYTNVVAFGKLAVACRETDEGWRPITKIAIEPKASETANSSSRPIADDPEGEFFVIEGGHADFRKAVLLNMHYVRKPEDVPKDDSPKPLKATELTKAHGTCSANATIMAAKYMAFSDTTEIDGKNRLEWDANAASLEGVQKGLEGLKDLHPIVQAAVDTVVAVRSKDAAEQKAKGAFEALNTEVLALLAKVVEQPKVKAKK